jgi:diazepam-binding inhibitor (GABA receptor modulating acyl-CoA-binding protein)
MSEAKFNKAVEIVGGLPKDGPVKPTQEDQLFVSLPARLHE